MTPETAIASMRAPAQMQIIALDVTNRCDLQCVDMSWDEAEARLRAAGKLGAH